MCDFGQNFFVAVLFVRSRAIIDVGLVVGFPEIARRRWRKRLANRALRRPFSVIAALLSLIFLAEGDRALPAEVTEAP